MVPSSQTSQWNYQLTKQNWLVCGRAEELSYYSTGLEFKICLRARKVTMLFEKWTPTFQFEHFYFVAFMGSLILATNQSYLHYFNNFLAPAVGNNSHWLLCWRATLHGFNASQFHSRCDGKNHTVTIVKNSSYVFGGYTDIPWGKKMACLFYYRHKEEYNVELKFAKLILWHTSPRYLFAFKPVKIELSLSYQKMPFFYKNVFHRLFIFP